MNRRNFLFTSAYLVAGSFFGMSSFSKVFAFEKPGRSSFSRPHIALVIDDIGYSLSRAKQFLDLDIPITFSILPRLTYSRVLAFEIHDRGHEIMLHQPMEPYDSYLDPGPGALYVGDRSKKIFNIVEDNISDVPFAIGVNNHMGSRFTGCRKEVTETLSVIKNSGLFFLDSRTSSHSKAYDIARTLHMPTAYRNIFLDNSRHEPAIRYQLYKLERYARKYGHAIGIGHPFPETVKAIDHFAGNLMNSDVSLVHVSKIVTS